MRPYSVVDDILILLLLIGGLFLLAHWLLFFFGVKRDKYWDTPTRKEQARMRQRIYEYIYQNPRSAVRHAYPHLADTAEAARAYEKLNRLYREGGIDETDYNRELEKLLPKVNIEQDF